MNETMEGLLAQLGFKENRENEWQIKIVNRWKEVEYWIAEVFEDQARDVPVILVGQGETSEEVDWSDALHLSTFIMLYR